MAFRSSRRNFIRKNVALTNTSDSWEVRTFTCQACRTLSSLVCRTPRSTPPIGPRSVGSNRHPIYRGTEAVQEPEYLTDAFAREAVSFIERHQNEPFFLYLPFNAVHTPMHATDKRLEKFASISDPMRRT